MKKIISTFAIATALVVGTAGSALACHISDKSASNNCDGQVAFSFTADQARNTQHTVVYLDGVQVADISQSQSRTAAGTATGSLAGHTVTGKLYWQGHLEDTESVYTLPQEGCTQVFPFRLRIQMMNHAGPIVRDGTFEAAPGSPVSVTLTRAPKFFKVVIRSDGTVVSKGKYRAGPRTQIRVSVGTIDVRDFARLPGRAPQTFTYNGVV